MTTALPRGRFAVTVDLHVNFPAPAEGARPTALAQAVHVGGTIGTARVEIACNAAGRNASARSPPPPCAPSGCW